MECRKTVRKRTKTERREKTDNAVHFENIKLITRKITSTSLGFQFYTFWRNTSAFRVTVGWEEEVSLLYSKDIMISGQRKLRNVLKLSCISDKSIYCSINMHQIITLKTEQRVLPKRRNIQLLNGAQTHKQPPRKDDFTLPYVMQCSCFRTCGHFKRTK